jgi:hypothetical protein
MPKITISSADLAFVFRERLLALEECSIGVSLAIVPDPDAGWVAVFPKLKHHARRRRVSQEQIDRIQRDLQRRYRLSAD